jgi:hypothetical protein
VVKPWASLQQGRHSMAPRSNFLWRLRDWRKRQIYGNEYSFDTQPLHMIHVGPG